MNDRPSAKIDIPWALTDAQVAEFVDNGHLLLRGCFSPEVAAELVHSTTELRQPAPAYRDDDARHAAGIEDLDLRDPMSWTRVRADIATGRRLSIADFAPKLWGAVVTLLGGEHNVGRRSMGEQWILKARKCGRSLPPPRQHWHIDEPGPHTTLEGHRDALALLILWSDVADGGGGPLYSTKSLDSVVAQLEASAEGVDTRKRGWGTRIAKQCGDGREFVGAPGDVLITHALSLHSAQRNHSAQIRILENPMIHAIKTLNYHPDNPHPSPVEQCVISRLKLPPKVRASSPPPSPEINAPRKSRSSSPRPSSPGHSGGSPRSKSPSFLQISARPPWAALFEPANIGWLEARADGLTLRLRMGKSGGDRKQYDLVLDAQRPFCWRVTKDGRRRHELDKDLLAKWWAEIDAFFQRLLWIQHVVHEDSFPSRNTPTPQDLDLARTHRSLRDLRLNAEGKGHGPMEMPAEGDDPFGAKLYLAISTGQWPHVLARAESSEPTPPWIALVLHALSGDVGRLQEIAGQAVREASQWGGGNVFAGLVLKELGFVEEAFELLRVGLSSTRPSERALHYLPLAELGCDMEGEAFARDCLRWAIEARPGDDHLLLQAARGLFRYDGFTQAAQVLEARAERGPDNFDVFILLAEMALWCGRSEDAEAWLDKARVLNPEDHRVLRAEGAAKTLQNDLDGAQAMFESMESRADSETMTWLAELHWRRAEFERQRGWTWRNLLFQRSRFQRSRVVTETERASQYTQRASARAWTPAHALLTALIDRRLNHHAAAIVLNEAELDGRSEFTPPNVEAADVRKAFAKGMELYKEGKAIPACAIFDRIAATLGLPEVERLLTSLHGNRKQAQTRIPDGRPGSPSDLRVVRSAPQDGDFVTRNLSAELLKTIRNRPIEALHEGFRSLTERFPQSPHPWCYWGELRLWLGQFDEAEACFRGNAKAAVARWGYVGRAAAHIHRGQYNDALREFRLLEGNYAPIPGATTHVYLGELHRLRGDFEQSIREFEIALSSKPGRVGAKLGMTLCHAALGRWDEAQVAFRQLTANHPGLSWDVCRSLGIPWPAPESALVEVLEEGLRWMRGNRSSHTITYFDPEGRLRILQDATAWRERSLGYVRLVEQEIIGRMTG